MISRLFSSEVVKWCYKSTYIILPFSEQTKTERCSVNPVWEYLVVASLLSVFLCLNLPKGLTSSLASPSFPHSVQFLLHITAVSLWRLPASVSSTIPLDWSPPLAFMLVLSFLMSPPCLLVEFMHFAWFLNIGDLQTL